MNGSFEEKAILKTVKLLLLNDYYFIDRMELVIPNIIGCHSGNIMSITAQKRGNLSNGNPVPSQKGRCRDLTGSI